ncbi:hypothetical protein ACE02U_08935 [Shewanella xiamenensis]|uniref:hypothetical protein n=1 Tax=Shewanella xiamenensis TaxID=332186 RepID=UPI0035BA6003
MDDAVAIKKNIYFLNSLLVPFIGITVHIKTKADTLTSIDGLNSKDVKKIIVHASEFNKRIWLLWFIYFLSFCSTVIVTLLPIVGTDLLSAVCFSISLLVVCVIASTSLYATDQAIQILIVHLKAKAIMNKEKKSALEELGADGDFTEEFKSYLSKQRGE